MSFHYDYQKWQSMTDPKNCPICKQEPMPAGMEDIVELANSWLSSEPFECLRWACHLIAKKHVVELFEFDYAELLSLMIEVQLCAKALKEVTGAVKSIMKFMAIQCHTFMYTFIQDTGMIPSQGNQLITIRKSNGIWQKNTASLRAKCALRS